MFFSNEERSVFLGNNILKKKKMSSNSNLILIGKWILFPFMIFIILYGIYFTFTINESNYIKQIQEDTLHKELMNINQQTKELKIIIDQIHNKNESFSGSDQLESKLIRIENLLGIEYEKKNKETNELKEKIKELESENQKLRSEKKRYDEDYLLLLEKKSKFEEDYLKEMMKKIDFLNDSKNNKPNYQIESSNDLREKDDNNPKQCLESIERNQLKNEQKFEEMKEMISSKNKNCGSLCSVKMLAFNLYEGKKNSLHFIFWTKKKN